MLPILTPVAAIRWLALLFFAFGLSQAQDFTFQIRKAIFSDRQFFWPDLQAPEKPSSGDRAPLPASGLQSARLGVLPIRIRDYRETIPCDSCHRLSANGMEFYLENYLKDKLAGRFPKAKVELIAPHFQLIENQKLDLLAYLDSLSLPWGQWFPDSGETLVYRPRDRMVSPADRKRLDRLGGLLNQDYLLFPMKIDIHVTPFMSNGHTGGLAWEFGLVFWNVAKGRPEWAFLYAGKAAMMDLDKSLDTHLDKALGAAWDGLPSELNALWRSEPR